jgi:hypothetical protein
VVPVMGLGLCRCLLLADQHDRHDPQSDPRERERRRPFPQQQRGHYRNGDGADGSGRRHHPHYSDGECAIQERDADSAGQAGDAAPEQIGLGGRGLGQQRQNQYQQGQPAELRENEDRDGTGAPGGEAAGEIGGTIEQGGADRQEVDHYRSTRTLNPP